MCRNISSCCKTSQEKAGIWRWECVVGSEWKSNCHTAEEIARTCHVWICRRGQYELLPEDGTVCLFYRVNLAVFWNLIVPVTLYLAVTTPFQVWWTWTWQYTHFSFYTFAVLLPYDIQSGLAVAPVLMLH